MHKYCPNTNIGSGFLAKKFGKYEELFKEYTGDSQNELELQEKSGIISDNNNIFFIF